MTDYTKLIERLRAGIAATNDAAAAIEALQGENERQSKEIFALTGEVANKADYAARMYSMNEAVKAERDALQAENEFLKQDRDEWRESTVMANANAASEEKRRRDMQEQRDALAAKLVTLEADAERYRWTVKQDHKDRQWLDTYDEFKAARDKRIDAAIDAAKGGQHEDA